MREDCDWLVGSWSEMELIEAVQSAIVAAFGIPEIDRDVALDLYDQDRRIVATGRSERYTRVEIIGIAARSVDAKRALFRAISNNIETAGVPRGETRIYLIEPPPESWCIKGGLLASEADLDSKSTFSLSKGEFCQRYIPHISSNAAQVRNGSKDVLC
ncbi:MAG: tautomerase family protein [Hyphomicrobium sp.]